MFRFLWQEIFYNAVGLCKSRLFVKIKKNVGINIFPSDRFMERAKEKEQPMYIGVDMVKAARWERICEKFPSRLEKNVYGRRTGAL